MPNQHILYHAFDVEEVECVGLEEELWKQPWAMMAWLGKCKGKETASPVQKVAKLSDASRPLVWGNWVFYVTATMYYSIDWNMEKN